ncbi:MAG: fibronectin type III-like domain-contianing protein [Acidobacteriota bacterium]|nr:fibronectin type III-like domain-contianing protein [Acidobacteriota bacterium]
MPRPLVELKGFERVRLKAGESRRVTIVVPLKRLEYWDESADRFVLE